MKLGSQPSIRQWLSRWVLAKWARITWASVSSPAGGRPPHTPWVSHKATTTATAGPAERANAGVELTARPARSLDTGSQGEVSHPSASGSAGDVVVDVEQALAHRVDHRFHPRVQVE